MSFHTAFDEPVAKIAREATTAAALKVFLILPQFLSYTVFRRLDREAVAAAVRIDGSSVSRALKQLHELGAIDRKGKGPFTEWKLSPDFGWRGDVDAYHAEQRKRGNRAPAKHSGGPSIVAEGILWKQQARTS